MHQAVGGVEANAEGGEMSTRTGDLRTKTRLKFWVCVAPGWDAHLALMSC